MTTDGAPDVRESWPHGRVLPLVQLTASAVYFGALATVLGRAWTVVGHIYLPRQGDRYDNLAFWPGELRGLRGLLGALLFIGPFVTGMAAGLGILRLIITPPALDPRRWLTTCAGTALALTAFIVSLTPWSQTAFSWLLD